MLSPVTLKQFERLKDRYAAAELAEVSAGTGLLSVPEVALPPGWSAAKTGFRFIVPAGYPGPAPDCFWADEGLMLAGGAAPKASQINPIPGTSLRGRWFSWHVIEAQKNWNPNRDDLLTFAGIVLDRLRRPE